MIVFMNVAFIFYLCVLLLTIYKYVPLPGVSSDTFGYVCVCSICMVQLL